MAKRGYRGKHPYSDMKVAPTSHKAANTAKLTAEYNKTGVKHKYDYIKSHDGFYPQATATVTCHANNADTETIVIISTDGTSVTYTGEDDGTTEASNLFNTAGNATVTGAALATCINHASGHGGKIVASADTGVVTLTQVEPGPDGNTTITSGLTGGSKTNFTGG